MSADVSRMMKTTPCRGCGKPIVWGITSDGKKIPLDPTPPVYLIHEIEVVSDANRAGEILRTEQKVRITRAPKFDPAQNELEIKHTPPALVSHFATCPAANKFSSSRKPAADA